MDKLVSDPQVCRQEIRQILTAPNQEETQVDEVKTQIPPKAQNLPTRAA